MAVQITISDPQLMPPEEVAAIVRALEALAVRPVEGVVAELGEPIRGDKTPGPNLASSTSEYYHQMIEEAARQKETPEHESSSIDPSPLAAFAGRSGTAGPEETGGPLLPPPPPPAVPDRDARGLPWDGRIHASTKAVNADGTWRNKRGVESTLLASVEAELRAAMAAPVPVAAEVAPPPPAAPAPGLVPAPPASTAPSAITFPQLVRAASERVAAGTLTQADIVAACQSAGLPSLPMLAARPDLVPTVAAALGIEVAP